MSSGESLDELAAEFVMLRQQEARVLAKIAELDRGGESVTFGSVSKMISDVGRVGVSEARRMAERALALHGSVGLSGGSVPPVLPNTAAAYADGAVSGEHIDKIRALGDELPSEVLAGDSWPIAEAALADYARHVCPRGLTRPIREFQARLDPDGQAPDERELAEPHREVRLRQRRTRFDVEGCLDLETGLQLQALLDALGAPRGTAVNGGSPDTRTTAQRHGDAFADVLQLAVSSGELPENGGEPFTILLTTTASGNGIATAPGDGVATASGRRSWIGQAAAMDGTPIPPAQVQRIACDATFVTKDGKQRRSAPPALRRALIARDQGCAHPDCDRPPALTHAHHIHHHAAGGETSAANMVLLCSHHHRLVHHTNWTVRMVSGRPRFHAPQYRRRPDPLREREVA